MAMVCGLWSVDGGRIRGRELLENKNKTKQAQRPRPPANWASLGFQRHRLCFGQRGPVFCFVCLFVCLFPVHVKWVQQSFYPRLAVSSQLHYRLPFLESPDTHNPRGGGTLLIKFAGEPVLPLHQRRENGACGPADVHPLQSRAMPRDPARSLDVEQQAEAVLPEAAAVARIPVPLAVPQQQCGR
jgi:hypothetical protein